MTIQYAATASDGSRHRADTREQIDSWAAQKCAAGCEVDVWTRLRNTHYAKVGSAPILVGRWEPLHDAPTVISC